MNYCLIDHRVERIHCSCNSQLVPYMYIASMKARLGSMNWNEELLHLRCSVADWFLSALEGSDKVKYDGYTNMA